ncbi:DUF6188 family protein [Nocardioides sp. DS6]|uniref:DUF6188 family protein n=1 Tax=Nocardioides eburneus TaxID=3231482 RepID=A0ABV3T046_9ACTN
MIPDFAGQTIDIVRIDWGLHLWTSENWEFVLSNTILITVQQEGGVEQHEFDPDVEERPLPPVLEPIVGARIEQVLVSKGGDLSIQLAGMHLTVPARPRYEAWQLAGGKGNEMFICMPRGELMHFSPLADEPRDEERNEKET